MKKLETFKPKLVEKRWGSELWTANDSVHDYCGKILHIKEGHSTSMHYHEKKHETFHILEGTLKVEYINTTEGTLNSINVCEGESMKLPVLTPHKLYAFEGSVTFIESSTYHMDSGSFRIYL